MNIVFLDSSTLDRGDIDFAELEAEGQLVPHPISSATEAVTRSAEAGIIITNKVPVGAGLLAAAPGLKLVVSAATGVNQIDLDACRDAGVAVANVAGYSTESVAQHTFALILELATRVGTINATVRDDWPSSPVFTRLDHPLFELAGRTLGIVGLGSIGRAVARIGSALGMKVIALARNGAADGEIPRLPDKEFFATADVVTLHCPLTPETEAMINAERLSRMKPGALLINTGRGPLIDEAAVAGALRSGQLGGAGLDVLSVEPPPGDHRLLATDIPNLIITPHTAWSTREARRRLLQGIIDNIRAFKSGRELNRIV